MMAESLQGCHAFFRDDAFEGCEPVVIVGFSAVGIAGGLGFFDLLAEHGGPLAPGEQTFLIKRNRHGERMGFPWRAENWPVGVSRNAWHSFGGAPGGCRVDG